MTRRTRGEGAAAAAPPGREPVRTCVGCGERAGQASLRRLKVEGESVILDGQHGGGRGAWLHARETCLRAALKRRSITRALRRPGAQLNESALRAGLTGIARKD